MLATKLVAALLRSDDALRDYRRLGLHPDLFRGDAERELGELLDAHVRKYGALPSAQTVLEVTGLELPEVPEPPGFYRDKMVERHVHARLKRALLDAQDRLNDGRPLDAHAGLLREFADLHVEQHRAELVDYAVHGHDVVRAELVRVKKEGSSAGLRLGWPTLDDMAGGLQPGDVLSIVGRPARGKTLLLLYGALHAWRAGYPVIFVSMEMKPLQIVQRVAAMDTHTNLTHLKKAALSTEKEKDVLAHLLSNKDGRPFWIVDGALTATVDDIEMYCQQFKPAAVFIDGGYLIRSTNPRVSKWERVSDTAEQIKSRVAERLAVPVVVSYQLNREAAKKKGQDSVGVENIAYSDAVGQVSSVVLGLMQDESAETMQRRRVQVLKGRSGETGSFDVRWNFHNPPAMDFSEIEEPDVGDLDWI